MSFGSRSLLDPRMQTALVEDWSSRCTIQITQIPASSTQPSGQHYPGLSYANQFGMVNIPCRIGAMQMDNASDNEHRSLESIESVLKRTVKLNGYYPAIQPRLHRAVVDGVPYMIRGVEHDSERFSTRLMVELIKSQTQQGLP